MLGVGFFSYTGLNRPGCGSWETDGYRRGMWLIVAWLHYWPIFLGVIIQIFLNPIGHGTAAETIAAG